MSKPESPLDMLMAKLEQGVQSLFHSEQYEAYLKTMSKFHEYSVNNTILMWRATRRGRKVSNGRCGGGSVASRFWLPARTKLR